MSRLIVWGVGFWLLLMLLAIVNAGAREKLYGTRMSELRAHQLSTAIFSVVIFFTTFSMLKIGDFHETAGAYILLGFIWLGLTVSFEFMAGHYVFGNSWEKLLADYKISKGRVWIFVLLSSLLSPVTVGLLI